MSNKFKILLCITSISLLYSKAYSQIGPISPIEAGGGGVGDMSGPGSSTDNAVVRWDGATGTLTKDSTNGPFVLDTGELGVGTSAPVSKIHVAESTTLKDATNGITIQQSGTGDAKLQILHGAERWSIGSTGSGQLRFSNDANLTNSNVGFTSNGALFMSTTNNVPIIDLQGSVTNTIKIKESADHSAGLPGDGNSYVWVKNDSPRTS